jgi:pyridoxamine 5'-phosphate oxidase
MEPINLAALREEYIHGGLDLPDLVSDPIEMFERWFADAAAAGLHEPNAMVLSTADGDGVPSSRMVLLKGVSERGFVFFTNAESRKGHELAGRPECALLFPWHPLERQVRVQGVARPLPRADVAA